jgi:signal transduction histidine kinase
MSGKQTDAGLTMQEGVKQNRVTQSQPRQCRPNHTSLGAELKSLNLKLSEISSLVDQISQDMGSLEPKNPDSSASDPDLRVTSASEDETAEPALVYRLCALMDLLRKHYGFDDSGIFWQNPMTGRLEARAVSPLPGSADQSPSFEEQVGILWKSPDIRPAIEQQRRQTLAAPQGGRFLVVPLGSGDRASWYWVMYFRENLIPESLPAADLVLWSEVLGCCTLYPGADESAGSGQKDGFGRMDRERIHSTIQLGRALTHEINNPLQVIIGRAQLLKMNLNKSGGKSNDTILDAIEGSAGRISSLMKDFSDHLHRQSDEITDGKEVNLLHILESDLPLLKYLLNSRRINLETDLEETLPSVSGNPGELETVVLILIRELEERLPSGGTIGIGARVQDGVVLVDLRGEAKDPETGAYGDPVISADRVKTGSAILETFGGSLEVKNPRVGQVCFRLRLAAAPAQVKRREP